MLSASRATACSISTSSRVTGSICGRSILLSSQWVRSRSLIGNGSQRAIAAMPAFGQHAADAIARADAAAASPAYSAPGWPDRPRLLAEPPSSTSVSRPSRSAMKRVIRPVASQTGAERRFGKAAQRLRAGDSSAETCRCSSLTIAWRAGSSRSTSSDGRTFSTRLRSARPESASITCSRAWLLPAKITVRAGDILPLLPVGINSRAERRQPDDMRQAHQRILVAPSSSPPAIITRSGRRLSSACTCRSIHELSLPAATPAASSSVTVCRILV